MPRRLYRSRGDRVLFGVAGGLARYLDLDAAVVRIVWVLLVLAGGAGILLYLIAAIVIPEEPEGWAASAAGGGPAPAAGGEGSFAAGAAAGFRSSTRTRNGGGAIVIGLALVLVGAWLLLERFLPEIDPDVVWPVVLLVLGGALVLGALRR